MAWLKKTAAVGAGIGGVLVAWEVSKRAVIRRQNRAIPSGQKIVILGAGFAGINVAQELSTLLPASEDGHITLIDRNNFLLFTPMLTEVAGGELDPHHIVTSPRRLSPRIRFEEAKVHGIDLANKSVVLDVGHNGGGTRRIKADQLVIALGSVSNYHGVPGLREHSLGMKDIRDATTIHSRVLECLERASEEDDPAVRRELLTFVVGGGGYTGVETMAAMNDLVRGTVKYYPTLRMEEIRTIIVHPENRLLPELSPDLAAYAQEKLQQRGVQVLLNTKITSAAESYVEIEPAQRIATRTIVWAGGVKPNPLLESLDCKRGSHGGIVVDACCAVPDHPGVWALGDCAEVPKPGSNGTYAPTAQNATREGSLAARNIVSVLRGQAPRRFAYKPVGELALVGRHSGVAKLYGQHFSGFLAWAIWRAVYLSKMPGMAQRSRIAIDWLLDLIFGRDVAELYAESAVPVLSPDRVGGSD